MDLENLKQLKNLLEKLEKLEEVEKLQKEKEELLEYKRRYLAIKGIIEWDGKKPIVEECEKGSNDLAVEIEEAKTNEAFEVIKTNGRSYGTTIRDERKRRHLTIEEVCRKCGIARNTIYEIENNIPRNNLYSKRRLEDYYKIRIEDKLCEKEEMASSSCIDVSKIRETRKAKKLTLRELSALTGVPSSTIHEIENNKTIRMNIVKVNKIKKALGLI